MDTTGRKHHEKRVKSKEEEGCGSEWVVSKLYFLLPYLYPYPSLLPSFPRDFLSYFRLTSSLRSFPFALFWPKVQGEQWLKGFLQWQEDQGKEKQRREWTLSRIKTETKWCVEKNGFSGEGTGEEGGLTLVCSDAMIQPELTDLSEWLTQWVRCQCTLLCRMLRRKKSNKKSENKSSVDTQVCWTFLSTSYSSSTTIIPCQREVSECVVALERHQFVDRINVSRRREEERRAKQETTFLKWALPTSLDLFSSEHEGGGRKYKKTRRKLSMDCDQGVLLRRFF